MTFLRILSRLLIFAQMNFLDPMFFHGTSAVDGFTEDEIQERAKIYANSLLSYVDNLQSSTL